jgi:RND superfamily putative drug exporter
VATSDTPEAPSTQPPRRRRSGRLGALLAALGWLAAVVVLAPFAGRLSGVQRNEAVDYLPAGAQSTKVAQLQSQLPGGQSTVLLVVYHRDGALTAEDWREIGGQVDALAARYALPRAALAPTEAPVGNAVFFTLSIGRSYGAEAEVVPAVRDALTGLPAGLACR